MTDRRYDLAPLATTARLTRRQLQTALRISWTTLTELETHGLTDTQADRLAIRLGLFPWQVWPTYDLDGTGWDLDHPAVRTRVAPHQSRCEQP